MTNPPARSIRLYTVAEVADQLKVSEKQIRRWIASGELVAHRLGRQLRIADADLRAFLAQRRIV
jgi:excisionase family DNA binding protein